MTTLLDALAALPADARDRMILIPLSEYVELVREARGDGPQFVDSAWLSDRYGKSPEWWARAARAGDVEAFQEDRGSPWTFDRASCRAHLLRLQNESPGRRVKQRGPWSERRSA